MTSRLLSLFLWLAVAASAVFWGLRIAVKPLPVPGQAVLAGAQAPSAGGDLSRLLGQPPVQAMQAPAQVAAESRLRLIGLVAPRAGRSSGLAVISVDGKLPRTWAVGDELEPGLRLLAVGLRQAELGGVGNASRMTLTLPMLAEAQRGQPGMVPNGLPGGLPGGLPNGLPGGLPGAQPGALQMPPAGLAQRLKGLPPLGMPTQVPAPAQPLPADPADDGQPQQLVPPQQPGPATR